MYSTLAFDSETVLPLVIFFFLCFLSSFDGSHVELCEVTQKFENVSVGSDISLSHVDNLFTSLSELNILLASDKPQSSSF